MTDWLTDHFYTSSEQYFMYIQDENNIHNILNYIEMREWMSQPGLCLVIAIEKVWRAG